MNIMQAASPSSQDDGLTPLAVMLATMRRVHAAAEAACTHRATLAGNEAGDAAKAALTLCMQALATAKVVAPYVHARLRTAAAPVRDGERTHEEWIAELDRKLAEHDQHQSPLAVGGVDDARPAPRST
jgi:hypothetical protein